MLVFEKHVEILPCMRVIATYFSLLSFSFKLRFAACATKNEKADFPEVADLFLGKILRNVSILSETLRGAKCRFECAHGASVCFGRTYRTCDYKPFIEPLFPTSRACFTGTIYKHRPLHMISYYSFGAVLVGGLA